MTPTIPPIDPPSLGLEELDADHRQIAQLVNRIAALAENTRPKGATGQLAGGMLRQLHATTRSHFRDEERLMEAVSYPDQAKHRREHLMLLAELKGFILRVERGEEALSRQTVERLQQWLVAHIVQSDRPLAEAIRAGVGPAAEELSARRWGTA